MTQQQIAGTERTVDPNLNAAIEELNQAKAAHKETKRVLDRANDRVQTMLVGLNPEKRAAIERVIALGPPVYHFVDDNGEEVEAAVDIELKVRTKKTGAADAPIGQGVDAGDDDDDDQDDGDKKPRGVDPRLAAAAARDGNVEEDENGDVVVPEKSAKKTKGGKRGKRGK